MRRARPAVLLLLLAGCGRADSTALAPPPAVVIEPPPLAEAPDVAPMPREVVYFDISPAAVEEIRAYVAGAKLERFWLRYTIKGGGCSGFVNILDLDGTPPTADDFEFVANGIPCVVRKEHRGYARGVRIDIGEKGGNRGFTVTHTNPPKAACDECDDPRIAPPPRPVRRD